MKLTALPLSVAAIGALALAACQPVKTVTRLDCPATFKRLTRVSARADGERCEYRGDGDLAMTLQLAPVTGSPAAALAPFEQALRARTGGEEMDAPRAADTEVDLPGLHVRANDGDDQAEVKIGPVTIKADDGGALVRSSRDVRLKGQSLSPTKNGYRASFLLAGDKLKDGYRVAGYEAAGPRTGPLAVAVYTARTEHADLSAKKSIVQLVRRNGGV